MERGNDGGAGFGVEVKLKAAGPDLLAAGIDDEPTGEAVLAAVVIGIGGKRAALLEGAGGCQGGKGESDEVHLDGFVFASRLVEGNEYWRVIKVEVLTPRTNFLRACMTLCQRQVMYL